MKKNVLNLEKESDVLNIIEILDYGSTYFICKDKEILDFLDNCTTIINEAHGGQIVRFEEEYLVDMLGFYGFSKGEGLYKLISSVPKELIPQLHEDSYYMVKYMNQAFNEKRRVRLYLDESLHKYAKKLAKNDVIFDVDEDSAFFVNAKRELSIYEQIKQAFYRGDDYIVFDAQNISVATVRCYTSTISKMSGKKLRCNIDEGKVTVYFKPISECEHAEKRIIQILEGLKTREEVVGILLGLNSRFSVVISNEKPAENIINPIQAINEPPKFIPTLYGKVVTLEEYKNAENWERLGFASRYNWENGIKGDVDMYPSDEIEDNEVKNSYEDPDDDDF